MVKPERVTATLPSELAQGPVARRFFHEKPVAAVDGWRRVGALAMVSSLRASLFSVWMLLLVCGCVPHVSRQQYCLE